MYIRTQRALDVGVSVNKPDGFLFATNGEDEYIVDYIKRNSTVANQDDYVIHWTLDLRKCGRGNIKR